MMDMREEDLYDIFLYLHKSYYTSDCGRCLDIIAAYRVPPRSTQLTQRYWDQMTMVAKSGRYFGPPFKGHLGMNQGYLLYTTIFNVVLDTVLRHQVTVVISAEGTAAPDIEGF